MGYIGIVSRETGVHLRQSTQGLILDRALRTPTQKDRFARMGVVVMISFEWSEQLYVFINVDRG